MITRTLIALAALAAFGFAYGQGCCGPQGGHDGHHGGTPQGAPPVDVQVDKNGVQKATIVVNNGFTPGSLMVKAGQPVELTFDTKARGCATSVNFQGLNLKKDLTNGKKTIVTFTPKKAGTYTFACPMNMVKGTLIVK
jgi:plastocyanin domain-containing protein